MADTCPLCGAAVAIVGETTLHYEPTTTAQEVVARLQRRVGVLQAERDQARHEAAALAAAIRAVLADEESRPGGWGPDVSMVAVLRAALAAGR